MSNVLFISDLHFNHENLLGFRSEVHKKLFSTVNHMNEWIVEGINSVVRKRDLLWILGDVGWHGDIVKWLKALNGTKKIVLGNHDKLTIRELGSVFNGVYGVVKKYGFVMSHTPIHPQELKHRNWQYNVHGHIHHKEKVLPYPQYINVNVDIIGNVPISLEQLRAPLNHDGLEFGNKD